MGLIIKTESVGYANTYVVISNDECIIIDPAIPLKNIIDLTSGKKVKGIFLTHGHYDHFVSIFDILNYFDTKVYLHKEAFIKVNNPTISYEMMFSKGKHQDLDDSKVVYIHDGSKLYFNDYEIKVIATPGHTNCSLTFKITNHLFTGDTLFNKGVGRTDLVTGSDVKLAESIKKLLSFKEDYLVYPGHDESTSIFQEIKHNPFYNRIK